MGTNPQQPNPSNTQLVDSGLNIASFGVDQNSELYFAAYDGKIYTLTSNAIPEYPQTTELIALLISIAIVILLVGLATKRGQKHRISGALRYNHGEGLRSHTMPTWV